MALTSTYDKNTKTLTVTKSAAGDTLDYAATVQGAEANGATFGSDVTVINATKASKNIAVNLYDATAKAASSSLTSLTLGKGADEITVAGSALSITTGNGKDTLTLTSDTSKITITDFDAKNDAIILGAGMSTVLPTATFSGADLTLTFTDTGTEKATHTFTLTGGKDKKITIANSTGAVIWEQSFQAAGDAEYNFDNNNTGKVLTTDAAYVAGANRSQAITLNLTGNDQVVLGGKGNDTVVTTVKDGYYEIAGGKGNDTFVIASETEVHLTDYTLGGKEVIQLGEGLSSVVGHRTVGDNVYITLAGGKSTQATDSEAAKYERTSIVVVEKGRWDQIANEKKKSIKIVDAAGQEIVTKGFQDQSEAVIKTVPKATKQAPTANHLDFTEATDTFTLATGTGSIDAKQVNYITVSPSTPASIKAGQTYMVITGGAGKDTLIGADETIAGAVNTAYVLADQITYGTKSDEDFASGASNQFVKAKVKNVDGTFTVLTLGVNSTKKAADRLEVVILAADGTTTLASGNTGMSGSLTVNSAGSPITLTGAQGATEKTSYQTFVIPKSISRLAADNSFSAIDGTAVAKFANATAGLEYTYSYESNSVTLDGGKGNDYLMSGNAGANLYGGVGNDTLRGTSGKGVMYGGAGNDVFLLTGEGATTAADDGSVTYQTHTIKDYYSGAAATYETVKADATARKKAYGSDKIQIAFDSYKTKAPVAKATLTGGTFDAEKDLLTLTVEGQSWVDSVAAVEADASKNIAAHASVAAHFYGDSGITASDDAGKAPNLKSQYAITAKEGDVLTIVDQGITYKQTVQAATSTEAVVTASYNGRVQDNILFINGANSTKAMRLVAGEAKKDGDAVANTLVGGSKVDTLIGNGNTHLEGKGGNDIFFVQAGDTIADYSTAGTNGKDKIQVTSLQLIGSRDTVAADNVNYSFNAGTFTQTNNSDGTTTYGGSVTYTLTGGSVGSDQTITVVAENSKVKSVTFSAALQANTSVLISGVPKVGDAVTSTTAPKISANNLVKGDYIVRDTNKIETDGTINIGDFTINASTGAITFQQVTENPVYNAKKGTYASTKKVTDTMIRTFSTADTASVVSGGASTYLEVFSGIDDNVVAIKGGTKAAQIVNNGRHVSSIVGGNKADTITVGNYSQDSTHTDTTISVTSGKGNDVIKWDGIQETFVTDYTTVKFNNKGKMTAGDVLYFTNANYASDVAVAGFYGNDAVISVKDGSGYVTLAGGKDKNAIFAVGEYTVADTIGAAAGAENFATVSLADPHEYLLAKKTDAYAESNVHNADAAGGTSETWIINASIATKAQAIDGSAAAATKVGTIYGGKAADTITAGVWGASADDKAAAVAANGFHDATQYINSGAGNDVVYLNTNSGTSVELVTGAGADIIAVGSETGKVTITDYTSGSDKLWFLNDAAISSVDTVSGTLGTSVVTKGKKTTTTEYVDLKFTLTTDHDDDGIEQSITFGSMNTANFKVTRLADNASVPSSKNFFSLDYFHNKIEIGAKDFAANTAIDLTGANATDITVVKAAKKVTIEGAQNGAVISVESGGKNAITYKGNQYTGFTDAAPKGATYNGSAGADIYIAGGANASDTVVLGSGNDSILSGGKAHVVSGIGNNVFVLGTGDAYNIDKFSTTDKVVLASTTTLEKVSYNAETQALTITTSEKATTEGGSSTPVTGTITLNGYKAGDRVNIYQLGTNARGKVSVDAELVRSYGTETLTLAKGDSSTIVISNKTDKNSTDAYVTKKVDGSALSAAVTISDTTKAVTSFIGGSGKDTIYAFNAADGVTTTLTGGKGNDYFILGDATTGSGTDAKNAQYVITDYEAGDVIQFGSSVFANIANYSPLYSIDGSNVVLSDTGLEITVTGGVGKTIQLNTSKISFTDPVNVVLGKNDTLTNWTASTNVDASRVETFDASANTKDAVSFTATGASFTKFTGNTKGSTVVINATNNTATEIDLGKGGGTLTLAAASESSANKVDTVKYSGGNIEVTNFNTGDVLNGVEGITKAEVVAGSDGSNVGGKSDSSVTFTVKSNTIKITGTGVTFKQSEWKEEAKESGKTENSDTYVFSYDRIVNVAGVGDFTYGTFSTEGKKSEASTLKSTKTAAYDEQFDTAYSIITAPETLFGSTPLDEITEPKVAVDITSTTNSEVDYGTGDVITFSSVVDKTKQK